MKRNNSISLSLCCAVMSMKCCECFISKRGNIRLARDVLLAKDWQTNRKLSDRSIKVFQNKVKQRNKGRNRCSFQFQISFSRSLVSECICCGARLLLAVIPLCLYSARSPFSRARLCASTRWSISTTYIPILK